LEFHLFLCGKDSLFFNTFQMFCNIFFYFLIKKMLFTNTTATKIFEREFFWQ